MPVTARDWTRNPGDVVEAAFAADGDGLAASIPNYLRTQVQVDFSNAVVAAIFRGEQPEGNGRAVFLEGETGVGKTHGYMVPALLHCVLTGQRMVVSTYTNELKVQVGRDDGPVACDVVERLTGTRPTIGLYLPYAEFASPLRCRQLAARLAFEGQVDSAAALRSLADWTENEVAFARRFPDRVVPDMRATVSAWRLDIPAFADHLPNALSELWCVDVDSGDDALFARGLYMDAMRTADCVVCTHALLVLDLKLYGRILGGRARPFAVTVVDEAHRMQDAARSVLGTRFALSKIAGSMAIALSAVAEENAVVDPEFRHRVPEIAHRHDETFGRVTAVADHLRAVGANRRQDSRVEVFGNEDWLAALEDAASACKELASMLYQTGTDICASTANSLANRADSIEAFVAAARDERKALGRTYVSFSPLRTEPTLVIDAKYGSRITQRLWSVGETGAWPDGAPRRPISKYTVFTSATIAQPGANGAQRWASMEAMLGMQLTPGCLDAGHSADFAPRNFGRLSFVFGHPDAPTPSYRHNDEEARAAYMAYAARCILQAADNPVRGRRNTLVLTNSFADTAYLGALLQEELGDRLVARGRDMPLARAKLWFATRRDAVLLTPGAWEGVNMPGLVDNEVQVRLPYVPPEDAFGFPYIADVPDRGVVASDDVAAMMIRVKQGIGRAIRRSDDEAVIWMLDPRFGLPGAMERRLGVVSPYPQGRFFQACIPRRFERARDAGSIVAYAPPAERPARRRA